jgi:UDP-N-acetylglucosamine--N-acetylmuramyl-(pentapeptide) pyrophosphoryl-undecaprenol N-acetylglucosamine transferase
MNLWAGKFAERIAVSYASASEYFPKGRVALTGNPVRSEIKEPLTEGAYELTGFSPDMPILFIIGGSLGSEAINGIILRILPELLSKYQILHQTGKNNYDEVTKLSKVVLANSPHSERYKVFDYLDDQSLRMAAGAASLIISRAGSTIFEIASWGKPSIIIPITHSNGDHQRKNAYNYARADACIVIEEANMTPQVLLLQIDTLLANKEHLTDMGNKAKAFSTPDAAKTIAKEIVKIALSHE